ncbi:MAG TPA: fibronectin type III domain-containing protein [Patescibacteria group bacterium]|nr:fibronectin type III domain-containing protein [Patescibacteria group bacterium]
MKAKIPSVLAIFILLTAITSSVFIINEAKVFTSNADTLDNPQDVRVTNIESNSFTVTWLTDNPSIGFVEYSGNGQTNESEITTKTLTHFVKITNLQNNTNYSFRINSSGSFFDNLPVSSAVTKNSSTNTQIISGQVFDKDNFPAKNALVYIVEGNSNFASIVTPSGNWIATIPKVDGNTLLQILVESSVTSIASAKINLQDANPVPLIILGNAYDFRNQTNNTGSNQVPSVQINLP